MSHWNTSGRARLKAKQNRSFSHRARKRAKVVAPESMLTHGYNNNNNNNNSNDNNTGLNDNKGGKNLYRTSTTTPAMTTRQRHNRHGTKSKRSYSNPILRRGIVVSIHSDHRHHGFLENDNANHDDFDTNYNDHGDMIPSGQSTMMTTGRQRQRRSRIRDKDTFRTSKGQTYVPVPSMLSSAASPSFFSPSPLQPREIQYSQPQHFFGATAGTTMTTPNNQKAATLSILQHHYNENAIESNNNNINFIQQQQPPPAPPFASRSLSLLPSNYYSESYPYDGNRFETCTSSPVMEETFPGIQSATRADFFHGTNQGYDDTIQSPIFDEKMFVPNPEQPCFDSQTNTLPVPPFFSSEDTDANIRDTGKHYEEAEGYSLPPPSPLPPPPLDNWDETEPELYCLETDQANNVDTNEDTPPFSRYRSTYNATRQNFDFDNDDAYQQSDVLQHHHAPHVGPAYEGKVEHTGNNVKNQYTPYQGTARTNQGQDHDYHHIGEIYLPEPPMKRRLSDITESTGTCGGGALSPTQQRIQRQSLMMDKATIPPISETAQLPIYDLHDDGIDDENQPGCLVHPKTTRELPTGTAGIARFKRGPGIYTPFNATTATLMATEQGNCRPLMDDHFDPCDDENRKIAAVATAASADDDLYNLDSPSNLDDDDVDEHRPRPRHRRMVVPSMRFFNNGVEIDEFGNPLSSSRRKSDEDFEQHGNDNSNPPSVAGLF